MHLATQIDGLMFQLNQFIYAWTVPSHMINVKRLGKASSIAMGLLVAFVANKWFEEAWQLRTDIARWGLVLLSLVFIIIALYFALGTETKSEQ